MICDVAAGKRGKKEGGTWAKNSADNAILFEHTQRFWQCDRACPSKARERQEGGGDCITARGLFRAKPFKRDANFPCSMKQESPGKQERHVWNSSPFVCDEFHWNRETNACAFRALQHHMESSIIRRLGMHESVGERRSFTSFISYIGIPPCLQSDQRNVNGFFWYCVTVYRTTL